MQSLAPIVLFVYNRPRHTLQTLKTLSRNDLADQSTLLIYADGPPADSSPLVLENISETRKIIKQKWNFRQTIVIECDTNKGLAGSIISGVTDVMNKYEKAIILEDDLITSSGFLKYMNEALDKYSENQIVQQISGHMFPLNIVPSHESFFLPMATSWGWGSWKRAWDLYDPFSNGYTQLKSNASLAKKFNLDNSYPYSQMLIEQMETNNINSWAIKWWWHIFNYNGLTLFPDKSLVKNIGFGLEGTHTKTENPFEISDFDPDYFINIYPETISFAERRFTLLKNYLKVNGPGKNVIANDKWFSSRTLLRKIKKNVQAIWKGKAGIYV